MLLFTGGRPGTAGSGPFRLVLLAALAAVGSHYYRIQRQRVEGEMRNQLSAIADLKVTQIAAWRSERIGDGEVAQASLAMSPGIQRLLRGSSAAAEHATVRAWMKAVAGSLGYANVTLVDAGGVARFSLLPESWLDSYWLAFARGVMASRRVTLTDLHRSNESAAVRMAVVVPLLVPPREAPVGALVLWVDPGRFLYPYIQSWPAPSRTAETLLVRREGDQVVYLNDLRHRPGEALRLRRPINRDQLPAAIAASGRAGIVSGTDYRGKPVLAATQPVPDSPWALVAKVDSDEILTPVHQSAVLVSIALLLFVLGAGPGIGMLWYQSRFRLQSLRRESDIERRALIGHYSYLSRYANDVVLLEDENGRIVEMNDRAEQSYGYGREEMLGLNVRSLHDPTALAGFEARWEAMRRPEGALFETLHARKDGSVFPVEVSARVIEVDGRKYCQNIIRDITERRRAEEELRRQLRMNEGFFEQAITSFVLLDPEYNFIRVNEAYAKACGRKVEDFPGRNHFEFYPSDAKQIFDDVVSAKKPFITLARPFTFPDHPEWGVTYWDWTLVPILDERGEVEFLVFSLNEVTERVRAEHALRLSEERYRSLVSATTQMVWTTNSQGEVLEDIPTWRAFTGQSEQEVRGWGWLNAVHPDDRERTEASWLRAVGASALYEAEYRVRRSGGEYRQFLARGAPVLEADGSIREWIGTCIDITERRRAEEEIARLNAELESRVVERTAQLEAANKELEAFSYSVSHDLRAPLRALHGFSRLLLEKYAPHLPSEAQHYLQVVRQNALQMGDLIDNLLAFSRLGRQPVKARLVAPADLVRKALEELHAERQGRQVQITIGELPPCQAEPSLLTQVFVNLLSNALKYTRRRETASIECGCMPAAAPAPPAGDGASGALPARNAGAGTPVYYVRDNGAGFDMRYADKLFGVFQRLHADAEYEGTGVGLAIAQRIIQRHGGRIWAEAQVGQGATFYFTIGNKT